MTVEGRWDILWLFLCSLLFPIEASVRIDVSLEHGLSELANIQQSWTLPQVTDGERKAQEGKGLA